MENKFGGNGDTEDQIYINHHPIDSATSSDYTLFYVIILIVAILLIVVAATIMICFCSKDKKFKFNHLKAKALHAEYETKLQNMIKPGQTINTKELANVIHNLTESNEENKEIMERLSMVDRKKRMQYTEETAEIFSSVILKSNVTGIDRASIENDEVICRVANPFVHPSRTWGYQLLTKHLNEFDRI